VSTDAYEGVEQFNNVQAGFEAEYGNIPGNKLPCLIALPMKHVDHAQHLDTRISTALTELYFTS
jgi:hypothetical protein